jgi:hypothetical protein
VSKKIDLSTYNLIYKRRSDGRKFLGKMITKLNRRVIDSVTGEVIDLSEYKLRRDFKSLIRTNRENMKKTFSRFSNRRGKFKKEAV